MGMSGLKYSISAGGHEATVVEVGAGLQSYRHDGVDVTCSYGDDTLPPRCCGATLVPWPNRIRGGRYTFDGVAHQLAITEPAAGNAIHGLGRWARWEKIEHVADRLTLRLDIVPQNGYPYQVRVEVTYSLHAEYGLTVAFAARNIGTVRAPFGVGSHPYLSTRGHELGDVTVMLPASSVLVVDEAQLPVGVRSVDGSTFDLRSPTKLRGTRFDDGFTALDREADGRGFAEVRTSSGGARLWFDDAFGYLQMFTPDELAPGTPGVAIEPMTCAPDAYNSGDGLLVLEPGGTWSGSWGILPL